MNIIEKIIPFGWMCPVFAKLKSLASLIYVKLSCVVLQFNCYLFN